MNLSTERVRILHGKRQGRTHIAVPIEAYEELIDAAERFGTRPKVAKPKLKLEVID